MSDVTNPYLLRTKDIGKKPAYGTEFGYVVEVTSNEFPILQGRRITSFVAEIYDEAMRVPHWHPGASELGYVQSGKMSVSIWKSPGEASTTFTVERGQMWFIPVGALHCLNSLGEEPLRLLLSFDQSDPATNDLSLAWNAIPIPILRSMVDHPHDALIRWRRNARVDDNYLILPDPRREGLPPSDANILSPFRIDLDAMIPLSPKSPESPGTAIWVVKDNWPILNEGNMAMLFASSDAKTALDPIWWPDSDSLFFVLTGKAEWMIVDPYSAKAINFRAKSGDMVLVPQGYLYTYRNLRESSYQVLQTFNRNQPSLPVSLAVSTSHMPVGPRNDAMAVPGQLDTVIPRNVDVFSDLRYTIRSPFFIRIVDERRNIQE